MSFPNLTQGVPGAVVNIAQSTVSPYVIQYGMGAVLLVLAVVMIFIGAVAKRAGFVFSALGIALLILSFVLLLAPLAGVNLVSH